MLMSALKKCLHSIKGKWVEELPGVLWAYRTTSRKSTGESPFTLTYGIKAIIPTKIGMPTIRAKVSMEASTETIIKDLDIANKLREAASMRIASYQQRLASWHNRRVKPHTFSKTRRGREVSAQLGRTIHGGLSRDSQFLRIKHTG